jgi:hypothetical protein
MNADQFGYVADPTQPSPTVPGLGPMHTEEQEQILRREVAYYCTSQGYLCKAFPQEIEIERERELPIYDAPVKLYEDFVITYKLTMESDLKEGCFLCTSLSAPPLVSLGDEQILGPQDVPLVNQDVQIAELPQRRVSVDGSGQDGTFEWDSGPCASNRFRSLSSSPVRKRLRRALV